MTKWYDTKGNGHDVVISSRVRLARNLVNFPFTSKADNKTSKEVVEKVKSAFENNYPEKIEIIDINSTKTDKNVLLEDHMISPDFCAPSPLERILITDETGNLSIMVNEEDHVRIQSIYSGFELDKAYETACKADDALSKSAEIAFDENLGYITACPTNLGTGLRASVMVHIPAICAYGYIRTLVSLMTKIGLTVRGLYGEGSEGKACMYQISNQVTLGISEKDAIEKLKNAVNQIISKEEELRKNIISSGDVSMSDKIWRSYGELKYARSIDTSEASRLISNVRLGAVCGIIPECKDKNLVKLLFEIMPAHIASRFSDAVSPEKRDEFRATYIREALK